MLTIRFSSPSSASEECTSSATITLSPNTVWCNNPAMFAQYLSAMWRVGENYFTSAEIEGPLTITFTHVRGDDSLALGPFKSLRLVSQYLFDGEMMIARVQGEKWFAYADGNLYEGIVATAIELDAPPTVPVMKVET